MDRTIDESSAPMSVLPRRGRRRGRSARRGALRRRRGGQRSDRHPEARPDRRRGQRALRRLGGLRAARPRPPRRAGPRRAGAGPARRRRAPPSSCSPAAHDEAPGIQARRRRRAGLPAQGRRRRCRARRGPCATPRSASRRGTGTRQLWRRPAAGRRERPPGAGPAADPAARPTRTPRRGALPARRGRAPARRRLLRHGRGRRRHAARRHRRRLRPRPGRGRARGEPADRVAGDGPQRRRRRPAPAHAEPPAGPRARPHRHLRDARAADHRPAACGPRGCGWPVTRRRSSYPADGAARPLPTTRLGPPDRHRARRPLGGPSTSRCRTGGRCCSTPTAWSRAVRTRPRSPPRPTATCSTPGPGHRAGECIVAPSDRDPVTSATDRARSRPGTANHRLLDDASAGSAA